MLARDSNNGFSLAGATSLYRKVSLIDTRGATNIQGSAFEGTTPVVPGGVLAAGITSVSQTTPININDNGQLNRLDVRNGAPNDRNNPYE